MISWMKSNVVKLIEAESSTRLLGQGGKGNRKMLIKGTNFQLCKVSSGELMCSMVTRKLLNQNQSKKNFFFSGSD